MNRLVCETNCIKCGKTVILSHVVWKRIGSELSDEIPVEEWYHCACKRDIQKKKIDRNDRVLLNKISKKSIPYWIPNVELIWNTRVNVHKGTRVHDLFSHRNLIALSILFHAIEKLPEGDVKEVMKFVFTGFVVKASRIDLSFN